MHTNTTETDSPARLRTPAASGEVIAPLGDSTSTVDALIRCRQSVLARAATLLTADDDASAPDASEALPGVTALLMASLEELKVAEEELLDQSDRLEEERAQLDERSSHYRVLFEHTPFPVIVTDLYGNVLEANLAASGLFKRQASGLSQTPMTALVAPAQRAQFRDRLAHFSVVSRVRNWPLQLQRVDDVPLDVLATVQLVPGIGETRSGALYWHLQPIEPGLDAPADDA